MRYKYTLKKAADGKLVTTSSIKEFVEARPGDFPNPTSARTAFSTVGKFSGWEIVGKEPVEPVSKIERLRLAAGLTQVQLAELSGYTQPKIAALESGAIGVANLPLSRAVALADALGVSAEELLIEQECAVPD